MKNLLLFSTVFFISGGCLFAAPAEIPNKFTAEFDAAYAAHPAVPRGMLEAVSFTMTRFNDIQHEANEPGSCIGLPAVYGVMGLTLDGKNYFRNNLIHVSVLSGYSLQDIISSPKTNIEAFAKAYQILLERKSISSGEIDQHIPILSELSELPMTSVQTDFALNAHLYSVYQFLNSPEYQKTYKFPAYHLDLKRIFGEDNYKVLSSPSVTIGADGVNGESGNAYRMHSTSSVLVSDYPAALWNPAATCNYTSGRTVAITAVVIHDVEGTYAGCISWFQNCSAVVSAHYVARSSDGQITQMVHESDKAWHVGSENGYTIGIEHEGYVASGNTWYTTAMLSSSAALIRDICGSGYGINPLRTYYGPGCTGSTSQCLQGACTTIKGHQMYPNQTHDDPGIYWNWAYYYLQVNNATPVTTVTASSGTNYDSGGPSGNYSSGERTLTLISPPGATSVTVNFTSFNTEAGFDNLFLYDGKTTASPLIGQYSGTTGPGTKTASSGSMLIEFRSDCATTAAGWNATYTSTGLATLVHTISNPLNLVISPNPSTGISSLQFSLSEAQEVSIKLIDMLGKEISLQSNEHMNAGEHQLQINATDLNLAKGLYFVKLITSANTSVIRMIEQ